MSNMGAGLGAGLETSSHKDRRLDISKQSIAPTNSGQMGSNARSSTNSRRPESLIIPH